MGKKDIGYFDANQKNIKAHFKKDGIVASMTYGAPNTELATPDGNSQVRILAVFPDAHKDKINSILRQAMKRIEKYIKSPS